MVKRKKIKENPPIDFGKTPSERCVSSDDLLDIMINFNIVERGVFFEGGKQFHQILVVSKKEEPSNEKLDSG